jgi:N-acetylglucosamine kinase-like BadF-type ATPase
VFIGVDGGGTKTAMVLIDAAGTLRAAHRTGGCSYLALGMEGLRALIQDGLSALLDKADITPADVDFAFFGLPAYGEESAVTATLSAIPARALRPNTWLCGNDMVCGWAGSLACQDGISVVAGTGSICYGERAGQTARCGGWGELFSDEGSAYWLAVRGLNLFSRMSDGRIARGPLYDLVRQRLGLAADLDVCGHVYSQLGGDRARIAQLATLVTEAAGAGDLEALGIVRRAAWELALMVHSTRRQLGFTRSDVVAVSHSGGVFDNTGPLLRDCFADALQSDETPYRLQEPLLPPAVGAALYAAKRAGHPLSNAAIQRLRAQT